MELNMNNIEVANILKNCLDEIDRIARIINSNKFNPSIQYLNKYSIIKACGTIEVSFKSLICDFFQSLEVVQLTNFLNAKVRMNSMNPRFNAICTLLKEFDVNWRDSFKDYISKDPNKDLLKSSLQSLCEARNQFAHGGNPTLSIDEIRYYYVQSCEIIKYLDWVLS